MKNYKQIFSLFKNACSYVNSEYKKFHIQQLYKNIAENEDECKSIFAENESLLREIKKIENNGKTLC